MLEQHFGQYIAVAEAFDIGLSICPHFIAYRHVCYLQVKIVGTKEQVKIAERIDTFPVHLTLDNVVPIFFRNGLGTTQRVLYFLP